MIQRYYVQCPGCSVKVMARIAVRPTIGTRFYFPCPSCQLPIEGDIKAAESLDSIRVEFVEAAQLDSEEHDHVVTVDPDIPMKLTARHLGEVGGAPNAMLGHLLGPAVLSTMHRISLTRRIHDDMWPNIKRLWEYYLNDDTAHFDLAARKLFPEHYSSDPSFAERDSTAFRASSF